MMLIYVLIGTILELLGIYIMIRRGELTSEDFKEPGQRIAAIVGYIFAILVWPVFLTMDIIEAIKLKH